MEIILLIDDDSVFRTALSRWLAEEGWNVLEAEDGQAGLRLAQKHRPRVIICDLLMPRCNGFQFCREIRADPEAYGNPKIVITSGSGYASDKQNALEAGANEYIVKPFSPKALSPLISQPQREASLRETVQSAPVSPSSTGTVVRFWGVRGSIATPGPSTVFYGGNTSCIEVRSGQEIIILDAGTGIRPLGLSLTAEFKHNPMHLTLLITHTHWDHIQGFPFFVPAYNPRNKVRILGFDGARKGLESTLSNQMESPYFPISMQQMPGNISIQELKEMEFCVGNVRVEATFMNHPGICVGYRLFTPDGSIAYLPDNELYQRLKTDSTSSGKEELNSTAYYAQSQDERFLDFVRNADVLIIDSQYDASEYPNHRGWGHSCVDDTVDLAIKANVKQLFLFHHDPGHDDQFITRMAESARARAAQMNSVMKVDAAREGTQVVLGA